MDKKDLIYFAGIVDGEGCIHIDSYGAKGKNKNQVGQIRLRIRHTYYPLIVWIKDTFGGSLYKCKKIQPRFKNTWEWQVSCKKAAEILQKILPYMKVKAQQARLVIKFQETKGKAGIGRRQISPETVQKRIMLKKRISELNHYNWERD